MTLARHVARMGRREMDIGIFCGGGLKDKDHLEDTAEDDRIILKWILKIG